MRLCGQETNSNASGIVLSEETEIVAGATVTVIHEPTQSRYISATANDGSFYFFNLKPGGPYSVIISSIGYENSKIANLYIHLAGEHFLLENSQLSDFILAKKVVTLPEVNIKADDRTTNKSGIETTITTSALKLMPTISRSIHDFVRLVPQAKVTGDGVMSLAGQNNRFNAFFIDGANNNDIQGLAVNGTNGGQTGTPPVSIEAIEEIKILLAPYNVQYGNFTGGSINAITRSGSNDSKATAWYYFRNESLAGRSPRSVEKPGSPGTFYRPRLSNFFNQTFGFWNSGALVKNKLFYFVLFESQSEVKPQPFNISEYRGNSNQQQLTALSNTLQSRYQYDPGSFLETRDELDAIRLNLKFDWNASPKDKFMMSYRYNAAERSTPRVLSSATTILFQNNGIKLPSKTHTASLEWNRFFKKGMNNRLLFTFTNQFDDRRWIGQPFPYVTILDGAGSIVLGSDAVSGIYNFKANDVTFFNAFKFIKNANVITVGLDINYSQIDQSSIPGYFGEYQFRNLNNFINSIPPIRFQRSFFSGDKSINDESTAGTKFKTLRTSSFISDEIKIGKNLELNIGLRLDVNSVPPPRRKINFLMTLLSTSSHSIII
jgi:outer membrane receptor for ferrienterochelin and colicin